MENFTTKKLKIFCYDACMQGFIFLLLHKRTILTFKNIIHSVSILTSTTNNFLGEKLTFDGTISEYGF